MTGYFRRFESRVRLFDLLCIGSILLGYLWSVVASLSVAYTLSSHPVGTEAFGGTTLSMITAGGLASIHRVWLPVAILAPTFAIFRFSPAYWWAGRRYGHFLIDSMALSSSKRTARAERAEKVFRKWGGLAVVFAYFLPIPNSVIFALAGWSGMSLVRFVVYSLVDSALYAGLMVGLGYELGASAVHIAHWITLYVEVLVVIVVLALAVAAYLRRRRRTARIFDLEVPVLAGTIPKAADEPEFSDVWGVAPIETIESLWRSGPADILRSPSFAARIVIGGFDNGTVWLSELKASAGRSWSIEDLGDLADPESLLAELWEVGPVTQTLTGTFFSSLLHHGILKVDETVGGTMGRRFDMAEEIANLSLVSLATHSSGLPQLTPKLIWKALGSPRDPFAGVTAEELAMGLSRRSLSFQQGRNYRYSQVGYALLGISVSELTGQDYFTSLTSHLFDVYNIEIAGRSSRDLLGTEIIGHKRGRPIEFWNAPVLDAAVGAAMSAREMLHWVEVGVSGDAEVRSAQFPWLKSAEGGIDSGLGWLGTSAGPLADLKFQSGDFGGFSAAVVVSPSTGQGVFALCNSSGNAVAEALIGICSAIVTARAVPGLSKVGRTAN